MNVNDRRDLETSAGLMDAAGANEAPSIAPRRKRGRPLLMSRESVLERIQHAATRGDGLYRVHLTQPALYARARRMFGSWSAAVAAAGLDYGAAVERARSRSLETRKKRRER